MKLNEIYNRDTFSNFDEMFHYLMNNCRPALKQMATPLYRGMHGAEKYDNMISPCNRGNHLPADDELHIGSQYAKFYDQWMMETFNYPFLTKGLFTTGNRRHSEDYGEVFIILPIGDFEYVWSPQIGDQIEASHHFDRMGEYTYKQFKQIMDDAGYTNKGIGQAVRTGHEVILKCGRYFHISEATLREWDSEYDSLEELWTDLRG